MTTTEATVARIYLNERDSHLPRLLRRLQQEGLRGVTVLRGIAGFGRSGTLHTAALVDLSLNLPIVIEFFDEPTKVETVLRNLGAEFSRGHVITWSAQIRG